jgi:hypothetical protein
MSKRRGRRTAEELENVSTADMTPAEYERSDTPGAYMVEAPGQRITVSGLHSAKVVAKTISGTIRKVSE